MKNLTFTFFVLTICFLVFPFSYTISQSDSTSIILVASDHVGKFYIIETVGGIEYLGEVIKDDGREVWVLDERLGLVMLPKYSISEMILLDLEIDMVGANFIPTGVFTTRYVFTTNAFPIEKGKHYAMINLFGPEAHFAVNDKLNIGVMTTWIASPISFVTKYSFSKDEVPIKVSVGGIIGNSGYLDLFKTNGGIGFVTLTKGTRQNNISLSLGYGFLSNSYTGPHLEAGTYALTLDYVPSNNYSNTLYSITSDQYPGAILNDNATISGPILSLAFTVKIGRNSSLVFDSMLGKFSQSNTNSTVSNLSAPSQNQVTNLYEWDVIVERDDYDNTYKAAVFMPGVRIQRSESKAFQFAIAGVTFSENGSLEAFPIPMVTLFRGFN